MDISFECPHCRQPIVIVEAGAGLQVDCPRCQSPLIVPGPAGENPSPSLAAESAAQYRCNNPRCGGEWSEHQLAKETFEDKTILLCPKCRLGVTKITPPVPFWSRAAGAFAYPFLGNGIWILVSATLLLTLLELAQMVPIMAVAGLLAGFVVGASFGMLLLDVIRTTAMDEVETMEWPDVGGWNDLAGAYMELVGSALLVFLPAMVCGWLISGATGRALSWCLWGFGAAYYPMALLVVAMLDSVSGVNPLLVVPAIIRTFPQYLLVLVVLAAIWLLYAGVSAVVHALPLEWKLAVYLPVEFCSLYCLAVAARLLGLLYQANADRLGWLEE